MPKRQQYRNICKLCGRAGSSREHIIAEWIGASLGRHPPPGTHYEFVHETANPTAGIAPETTTAHGTAFYTSRFCRPCNTGWMSQLEEDVVNVLEPMIHGGDVHLDADACRVLAFWTLKTVFAFQAREDVVTQYAQPAEYAELYASRDSRALPVRSRVFVAAVTSMEDVWCRAHSFKPGDGNGAKPTGWGAILVVGHVLLYVTHGWEHPIEAQVVPQGAGAVAPLEPPLAWPPKQGFSLEQAKSATDFLILAPVIAEAN